MDRCGDYALLNLFPQWILNSEAQAVLLAGLCCVGAWVILSWLIQLMFSILWPFFVVLGLMVMMPSWRKMLTSELVPRHIEILKGLGNRLANSFNSTTN